MEIGAHLSRLELLASDPHALARFYASTFRLQPTQDGDTVTCSAPERQLVFVRGEGGQLHRAVFRFHERAGFEAHRDFVRERGVQTLERHAAAYTVRDPVGHLITFQTPAEAPRAEPSDPTFAARLQHFAVRTPDPSPLLDFYVQGLGFVLSDRVLDGEGHLTAAFLRTDSEHHSMAIFRAPITRFDHFSCEAPGWPQLRDWADHMAAIGVDLAWGIGRHGPGNDTFLMVKDMDGNMGEISSDLEVCVPGRPAGIWPHQPQTLNRWGVAIMRS